MSVVDHVYFKRENLSHFRPESSQYLDPVKFEIMEKTKDQRKQIAILGVGYLSERNDNNTHSYSPNVFTMFVYTFRKEIMSITYPKKGRRKITTSKERRFRWVVSKTLPRRMRVTIGGPDYTKQNLFLKNKETYRS